MKSSNPIQILCLTLLLTGIHQTRAADGSFDNLDVSGTTTLEGPVQIDDTANPSTTGQWNLTLENGLFFWGAPASSSPLNLDFSDGDTLMFWYPEKSAFRAGAAGADSWDEAAIGSFSVAFGDANEASGMHAFALGEESIATGDYSFSAGYYAEAEGDYSFGFGMGAAASGDYSFAFGEVAVASGAGALAFGEYAHASVGNSIAIGENSYAGNDYAMAIGPFAQATGIASIAFGGIAEASGDESLALGVYSHAAAFGSTAIGSYNLTQGNATQWISSDPLFTIGNGRYGSPSSALTILKDGRTTVGHHETLTNLQARPETLQVSGALLLQDYASPPVAPSAGAIRYDATSGDFLGYDGTTWRSLTSLGGIDSDLQVNGTIVSGTTGSPGKFSVVNPSNHTIGSSDFGNASLYIATDDGSQVLGLDPNQIAADVSTLFIQNKNPAGGVVIQTGNDISEAGSFYFDDSGRLGLGREEPEQKLHVNGAIAISDTATDTIGAIRFNGSDFEGYKNATDGWVSLTQDGSGANAATSSALVTPGTTEAKLRVDPGGILVMTESYGGISMGPFN